MGKWKISVEVDLGEQDLSSKQVRKIQKRMGQVIGDTLLGIQADEIVQDGDTSVLIGVGPSEQIDSENLESLQGVAAAAAADEEAENDGDEA